ncbi:MAG: amino acid permease [Pseudomonadota bacterium]
MNSKTVKKMGLFTCSAVVAGNMMGSGIALLPSNLAAIGSITIISWAIAILGALSLAYVFAKLGTTNPQEGGPIAYSEEVAPILGYQAGTLYFHANWIGNLAIAITGVTYLSVFFPALTDPIMGGIATIAIVWIFAILNLLGASWIGKLTAIGVALLLIPVVLTGIGGFYYFEPSHFVENWNISPKGDFHAVVSGVLLCLWSFIGVESATTDASLVDKPTKTIPMATMIGSGIAALVYVASCTAISGMFPAHEVAASGAPFSLAVAHIVGPWASKIVSALVAFGCLTSLGSWMMLVAQAGARTSHDKMLPAIFGRISKRNIPAAGIILISTMMSILMIILMFFSKSKNAQTLFGNVISIAVLLTILPYFYSVLNMLHTFEMKPKKIFFQIMACILGAGFCLIAIAGAQDAILVATVAASFIAMVFYERKDRSAFEKKIFEEIKQNRFSQRG